MTPLWTAAPACATSNDPACAALRDVYAQPKFSGLDAQPGGPSILSRIGDEIIRVISWAFSRLGTGGSLILGALAVAVIVWLILRRARGTALRRARADGARDVDPALLSDDADTEWKAADRAASAGDFREALRRAFRSALLDVARRGRLFVDSSWTTRELLESARGDADLIAGLAPAAALFDEVWYAGVPVTAEMWLTARRRCESIRTLARRPVASPVS